MKFFRLPKRNPENFAGETFFQRLLRYAIISLLFGSVLWALWTKNEKHVIIQQQQNKAIIDQTRTILESQEAQLQEYCKRFKENYGVTIKLLVKNTPLPNSLLRDSEKSDTLLFALAPSDNGVLLQVPPILRQALSTPLIFYLQHLHFIPYFANNSWPEGYAEALSLISRRLDAALLQDTSLSSLHI